LTIAAATRPDGGCRITVADSGPGIAAEAREHLFEPFFTTKSVGQGLGLGLVISRDIVRELGGELTAADAEAGGAAFIIDLPPVPPAAVRENA
jgi:two-component system C4-dicarboxylate transport sensor histidine kinase DctB